MGFDHVTLTIDEAFREGNISPDFLPPIIIKSNSNGKVKFVLSEKGDCYHTVTIYGCSCDQFASGVYPCSHQNRAWIVDVRKLAEREKRLEEEQEWLLKRKQEVPLEIEQEERSKKEMEERFKWAQKEEERLKKEEPEKYHELQEANRLLKESCYELMKSMGHVDEQFERERQEEMLKMVRQEEKLKMVRQEEKLKTQFHAFLKEFEQNKKTSQAGSPKEKTRFYESFEKLIYRNAYILLILYYLVYENTHRFCH